jgi:hypothetical protein
MHENILATTITDNESKPLIGIVPLHCADLFGSRLIGRLIGAFGPCAPRLLLLSGAGIHTQYFSDLQPLLTWRRPNFEGRARWHGAVAAAFDDTDVKKGITASGKFDEAEALFCIIPLHYGCNCRPSSSRLEARATVSPRISEIRLRRIVVIIKAASLRPTRISIFAHAYLGSGDKPPLIAGRHCSPSMMIVQKMRLRQKFSTAWLSPVFVGRKASAVADR